MADESDPNPSWSLLGEERMVVNLGVEVFEDSLRRQGIEVVVIRWQPPAQLPSDVAEILDELL